MSLGSTGQGIFGSVLIISIPDLCNLTYFEIPVFGVSDHIKSSQPAQSIEILSGASFIYYTFQVVNNKGADQTVQMHRLVCSFVAFYNKKCQEIHQSHSAEKPMPP